MKALIIYFTMGGRTKKIAEAIGGSLSQYELNFIPFQITGSFGKKLKILDNFRQGDYSVVEDHLKTLDAQDYDLVTIGMPTHGGREPIIFDEIINRMQNFNEKKVVLFGTSRMSRGGMLNFMREKVENKGAKVIDQNNFRGFFRLGTEKAVEFGKKISNL